MATNQSRVGMSKLSELLCRSLARKLGYKVRGGALKSHGSISQLMTALGEAYDRNPEVVVQAFEHIFLITGVTPELVQQIDQAE